MRRRPAILLLLALALVVTACGGDDGEAATTVPGESSTAAAPGGEPAEAVWYTDWDAGVVARWNLASNSCDGVTEVGLSADLIEVGLGWVWVTDCMGGQLVRLDVETGEVTGRFDLGACPSSMALAFDLVWRALPELGAIVAVDPETGAIVAEGTSDLDTVIYLAAGSLHAAGNTYYWRIDEVAVSGGGGNDVWSFKVEDVASTYTQLPGQVQSLAVSVSGGGGNDAAVLVGPPPDGQTSSDYSDPNYPTQFYNVGPGGATAHGDPLMGFYNYLAIVDGHYVATSKVVHYGLVANGAQVQVPFQVPGKPAQGPPPPGGDPDGGPFVWIPQREPGNIVVFPVNDPPQNPVPAAQPQCMLDGQPVSLWYMQVFNQGAAEYQASLAAQMDRSAFPIGPFPTESVFDTRPEGPGFSSCAVGYDGGERLLNDMEGTTDPGATVVLSIVFGDLLYADLATAVAGDDGTFTLPDLDLDDLTTPIPAGSTITVVYTADGFDLGSCELEVDT